ncbi:MAG: deoxyribose-phosphate aldolase [Anaerolineae bacterium]|nr:deoxyribose-phosphate aldolase [Anaerolineae bacterium]
MDYTLGNYSFDVNQFLPERIFDKITEIRVDAPEIIENQARIRQRRSKLAPNGKLTILAADHPGRGVTASGGDPYKMGNRHELMGRILRVLVASEFDGFMSTPEMIEDLLIFDYLVQQGGGPSILDNKVLIGCMQRGGIHGFAGEIEDRFGAYTAESIDHFRLDGGKMLVRFVPEDERTLKTVQYCAEAITALNRYELPAFVEPLRMEQQNGKWVTVNTAGELIRLVGIASGLGDSARNLWLKLPYCEDYRRVALATSLPIILLGGPSREDPRSTFNDFAAGMAARANVRGAMVGRNITFPGDDDPAAVAQGLHEIVHRGASAEDAIAVTMASRDREMDFLTRYLS